MAMWCIFDRFIFLVLLFLFFIFVINYILAFKIYRVNFQFSLEFSLHGTIFLFQLFSHNDIYFFNRSRKYSLLDFTLNKIDSVLFVHVKYLINQFFFFCNDVPNFLAKIQLELTNTL